MLSRLIRTSLVLIFCGFGGSTGVNAAFIFEETAFRSAIQNDFALENFDVDYSNFQQIASLPSLGIQFSPLSNGKRPATAEASIIGGVTKSGAFVLTNNDKRDLPGLGPIEIRPLDSGRAIFALGFWNSGGDDRTTLRAFDATDHLLEWSTSPMAVDNLSFIGIVSATPIYRIEISASTGNGFFSLDDLQVQVKSVPEPYSLTMLSAGLVAAVVIRRRRAPLMF